MSKKIILFLSDLKPNAAELTYRCPDGSTVPGAQTNDAPVRYLLRSDVTIREIICVVTRQARDSAWDHFQAVVREAAPAVTVVSVPYEEEQDFSQAAIPAILAHTQKGDEIFLETTGGFRNANMHLLLLSRVLSYCGIRTSGAVYSNFKTRTVEDISHLIGLFDLVGGMQELTGLGSVRTLREYYSKQPMDPLIDELLTSMEDLTESITLCRTARIKPMMERFGSALEAANGCQDPLMAPLLSAFRNTFGKKLTTPGLIRWCVKNDMLQQALTLYTEQIPAFIMDRGDILVAGSNVRRPLTRSYEDPSAVLFLRGFLMLSEQYQPPRQASDPADRLKAYVKEHAQEIIDCAKGSGNLSLPEELETGVRNLMLVMRLAYLDNGGVYDPHWAGALPANKAHLWDLRAQIDFLPANSVQGMLNKLSVFPKSLIDILLEREPASEQETPNYHVLTLQHLEELLPRSGYTAKCSLDRLAVIARDYLYIKALRNITNHANDDITEEQEPLIRYLSECGYKYPRDVTLSDLKETILQSLDHLRPVSRKESLR